MDTNTWGTRILSTFELTATNPPTTVKTPHTRAHSLCTSDQPSKFRSSHLDFQRHRSASMASLSSPITTTTTVVNNPRRRHKNTTTTVTAAAASSPYSFPFTSTLPSATYSLTPVSSQARYSQPVMHTTSPSTSSTASYASSMSSSSRSSWGFRSSDSRNASPWRGMRPRTSSFALPTPRDRATRRRMRRDVDGDEDDDGGVLEPKAGREVWGIGEVLLSAEGAWF